jgi:hypothetical protein
MYCILDRRLPNWLEQFWRTFVNGYRKSVECVNAAHRAAEPRDGVQQTAKRFSSAAAVFCKLLQDSCFFFCSTTIARAHPLACSES